MKGVQLCRLMERSGRGGGAGVHVVQWDEGEKRTRRGGGRKRGVGRRKGARRRLGEGEEQGRKEGREGAKAQRSGRD